MRRVWDRIGLTGTVLLSLPAALLVTLVWAGAVRQYHTFRGLVWVESSVTRFVEDRLHSAGHLARLAALHDRLDPTTADPPVLRLVVSADAWRQFQSSPLGGWDEWFPGYLIRTGRYQDIEFRKRGDRGIHYAGIQKSMTVKAPKGELVAGVRELALSRKSPVEQFLVHSLQSRFDIMAPATGLVPVFVNDRYYGLFRALELADESFLRRAKRMPGNIHRLDTFAPDERIRGVELNGFFNDRLWDRTAVNDRPLVRNDQSWSEVLRDLRSSNVTQFQRALARFDRDELASYMAFKLLVGDPLHNSNIHNQLWYQDPSSGLFHPIAWDLYAQELGNLTEALPDLIAFLLRDPELPAKTLGILHHALDTDSVMTYVDSLVEDVRTRFGPYLEYAELIPKPDLLTTPDTPEAVAARMHINATILRQWILDASLAVSTTVDAPLRLLDVHTRGRGASALAALRFDRPVDRGALRLAADQNRNGILDQSDRQIPLRWTASDRVVLEVPEQFNPRWGGGTSFTPMGQHYRLFLSGAEGATMHPEFVNAVTGGPVDVEPWDTGEAIPGGPLFHPWAMERQVGRRYVWSGTIELTETTRFGSGDTLVIEPGTVVSLAPDVSLISRGPVWAVGTPSRPVRFQAARPDRPWGALALQGSGTDRSLFRHVQFERGGGAVVDGIEYIGMLNVHWARGVVFDSILVRDNLRSDDALHAVHAEVRVSDARFERANADAIDLDYAAGVVERSLFIEADNDAIDLMGSSPVIRGNELLRSGDKGISIGEASSPIVTDNRIQGGRVGIEVKDRSEPVLIRNRISGNGTGLSAYAKNWRYAGGGFVKLLDGSLADNDIPMNIDAKSRVTLPGEHPGDLADILEHGTPRVTRAYSGSLWNGRREWFAGTGMEIEVDDWDLVVRGRGGRGGAVSPINWALTDSTVTHVLLLEYRVSRETEGVFRVVGETASHEIMLPATDSTSGYQLVVIPLPPDRYVRLEVALNPPRGGLEVNARTGLALLRSGQVRVHRYGVYAAGAAGVP